MKNKLKEEMLKEIFVQTGGRPENPKIADVCAEIAVKFFSSNAVLAEPLPHERCQCSNSNFTAEYTCMSCGKNYHGGNFR